MTADQSEVCDLIGHGPARETCKTCGAPVLQFVRVEVSEGRAYTYAAFEDPPLARGDRVLLPGNQVHSTAFVGVVIRSVDISTDNYEGDYKAVIARAKNG